MKLRTQLPLLSLSLCFGLLGGCDADDGSDDQPTVERTGDDGKGDAPESSGSESDTGPVMTSAGSESDSDDGPGMTSEGGSDSGDESEGMTTGHGGGETDGEWATTGWGSGVTGDCPSGGYDTGFDTESGWGGSDSGWGGSDSGVETGMSGSDSGPVDDTGAGTHG